MEKGTHKSLALYEQPQAYSYHNHIASPDADQHVPVDFTSDPDVVRLVVEGERLSYGHLFNPAFATEISMIEPLPHQRIAVYDHMLQQPRLRFLLADDAGAGQYGSNKMNQVTRAMIWWKSRSSSKGGASQCSGFLRL